MATDRKARTPSTVATTAIRLIAYIRVSRRHGREGETFQSPRQQREAILAALKLTPGAEVIDWIEEYDESGGTMNRPGVRRAIQMVESGEADGIICAYLDRWARTLEALEMIERWVAAGRTFISAADRFDASTSQGRFALGMMLLVAKYYRDRTIEGFELANGRAIARGVHTMVPYGFRRSRGDGPMRHPKGGTRGAKLEECAEEADVVRRIYGDRVEGRGYSEIARALNAEEVPGLTGHRWSRQSVRLLVKNPAYRGEARWGDHINPAAHDPLVTAATWEAAQATDGPAPRRNSLLAGLVRCAGCGYAMAHGTRKLDGRRYQCLCDHTTMICPAPTSAGAERLEALAAEQFLRRYGHVRVLVGDGEDSKVTAAATALESARAEYFAWRDDTEMRGILGNEDYRAGLKARKDTVAEREHVHRDAVRRSRSRQFSVDETVWSGADTAERRELLRAGIDAIVLSRAASTRAPLADRVEIIWTGELEHDGSRAGIATAVRGRK